MIVPVIASVLKGMAESLEGARFIRCDQCRSREACERAQRCSIIDGEHKPSAAFIDYPHDWRRDAREMGK